MVCKDVRLYLVKAMCAVVIFMHARLCLRDLCLAMSTDHLLKPYSSGVRPLGLQDMFVLVWDYFESVPWRMCTIEYRRENLTFQLLEERMQYFIQSIDLLNPQTN